jgi:hypothetical protein
LHNPHSGVTMAVNASLVSLGVAEPAFQFEIIAGQLHGIASGKESRLKTAHLLGHLPLSFVGTRLQPIA